MKHGDLVEIDYEGVTTIAAVDMTAEGPPLYRLLVRLDEESVEAVAQRVAELLKPRKEPH